MSENDEEKNDLGARIDRLEALVDREGREDLAGELGALLVREGKMLEDEGDLDAAENRYDCALSRLDGFDAERPLDVAGAFAGRARLRSARDETSKAIDDFRQADVLYEGALFDDPHAASEDIGAWIDMLSRLGYAHFRLGHYDAALEVYDAAFVLHARLPVGSLPELLGRLHLSTGNAYWLSRRFAEALASYDRAIPVLEPVAATTPRYERTLANALMGRANALEKLDRRDESLAANDRAVSLLRRAARADQGAAVDLGRALGNAMLAEKRAGRHDAALRRADESLAVQRELLDEEGLPLHPGELALAQYQHASLLATMGNTDGALRELEVAIPVLEAHVARTSDAQLDAHLRAAKEERKRLMLPEDRRARQEARARGAHVCAFCPKTQREVRKLIAGPDRSICNECIGLALDILEEDCPQGPDGERVGDLRGGATCNFCDTTEARHFVSGCPCEGEPTSVICDVCIDMCFELVIEESKKQPPGD
ncbi:Hypothetical protein A7982_08145 [Minicystis rosea]|nr:Hypothetical protein A7982_08145 [Minicystis rosea]